jgi:hypothetical protein
VTLIELMIAMAVLSFGLLAMWQLHAVGLTSNASARRTTAAVALANELISGLERVGYSDALVSGPADSATPPSDFGPLVSGYGTIASPSGLHTWSDGTPVPGVRLDTQIREMGDKSSNFARRWSVWAVSSPKPGVPPGTKVIAVSVTWNDPPLTRPREVVLYTYIPNPAVLEFSLATGDMTTRDSASVGR